jgi:hypothetical protein
MGGDGPANAEVSGSEREGERGRSDARVEPASFSVGNAERPEADVPPGLWQFAGKKLREAYFHAARASVRDLELNPRPARDEDRVAADPPDPEPGVRRVLSAIRDLAVAAAEVPAADDEDQTRGASNPKRRKKKETRVSIVCARFDADAKAAARCARADWRAAAALLLDRRRVEYTYPPNVPRPSDAETESLQNDETAKRAFTRRAVLAHLERAAESERRAKWRTETITGRHSNLRRRASGSLVASSPAFGNDGALTSDDPPNVAEIRETWRAATGVSADAKDAAHALAYAEAAEETGRKPWVTEALRWCHDFTTRFLRGGGAAAFALKAERRRVFRETGARMTDAEAAARLRALSLGHLGMDGDPGLVPAKPETKRRKTKTTERAAAGRRVVLGLLPRVRERHGNVRGRGARFGAAHAACLPVRLSGARHHPRRLGDADERRKSRGDARRRFVTVRNSPGESVSFRHDVALVPHRPRLGGGHVPRALVPALSANARRDGAARARSSSR